MQWQRFSAFRLDSPKAVPEPVPSKAQSDALTDICNTSSSASSSTDDLKPVHSCSCCVTLQQAYSGTFALPYFKPASFLVRPPCGRLCIATACWCSGIAGTPSKAQPLGASPYEMRAQLTATVCVGDIPVRLDRLSVQGSLDLTDFLAAAQI